VPQPSASAPAASDSQNRQYVLNDVPYSVLKDGSKPTYRTYFNKSIKNNHNNHNNNHNHNHNHNHNNHHKRRRVPRIRQIRRKTVKKTYKLGKKLNKTVSILLKNQKTRQKIQHAQFDLRNSSIADIKKILITKNLLRAGSIAPSNVIRTIFEASTMAGDVTNLNDNVFIHNYMSEQ
jgi:hypothetical protein